MLPLTAGLKKMGKKPSKEIVENSVAAAIIHIVSMIPDSDQCPSDTPEESVENLIAKASWKAAAISGGLALPPGPFGLATILPDLVAIWRIQAQLVSDIAAAYNKKANLTPEAMIYCLFRHGSAALFRDIVARVGERVLIKRTSLRVLQGLAQKIGVKVTQRLLGKGIARWLPLLGAVAIAWYAKYDTRSVGEAAHDFFRSDIEQDKT